LIRAATRRYLTEGRRRMIAFIWWSNTPSLRAFKKAGWKRIGFSMELRFGKHWLRLRVPLP
jgi:RimJ/RimL family protein N-acetyltransferase